jgi:hypothetical protein
MVKIAVARTPSRPPREKGAFPMTARLLFLLGTAASFAFILSGVWDGH